ncbi:hypothetical protein COP2_013221 [Malus domestica]|uniref:Uncharacterized protein n=1 Tax=Malus domestica TaxID=3750 RepID=A0A498IAB0_MALDO|nr:hypothetical protein DVH24_001999 [Malus domestica]
MVNRLHSKRLCRGEHDSKNSVRGKESEGDEERCCCWGAEERTLNSWQALEDISWSHIFREVNFLETITDAGFRFQNLHVWDRSIPSGAYRALLFYCM